MKKTELEYLLKRYRIQPRKEQGQNFLIDNEVVLSSVLAADINDQDTVLEIGPGFGVLTIELAKRAKRVIAVEQDQKIFPAVQVIAQQHPNLEPYNQDIRKFNLAQAGLQHCEYKLVANLPYSISSWVLRQFLEYEPSPSQMVVMLQKEVAERATAKPGKMSVLSCAVQCFAQAKIVRFVDSSSFMPAPAVSSAILKLELRDQPFSEEPKDLLRLIKVGFSAKRKQLHNNLQAGLQLKSTEITQLFNKAGIEEMARAQDLSLDQWEFLRQELANR